jgi:hypothetical protein
LIDRPGVSGNALMWVNVSGAGADEGAEDGIFCVCVLLNEVAD